MKFIINISFNNYYRASLITHTTHTIQCNTIQCNTIQYALSRVGKEQTSITYISYRDFSNYIDFSKIDLNFEKLLWIVILLYVTKFRITLINLTPPHVLPVQSQDLQVCIHRIQCRFNFHFQQYFRYFVDVSFIGGGKPPTCSY